MREEVHQAEQHGEGLLHAEEAVEGPFAMVLHDRLQHGRVAVHAPVGDDVLAGVVTFGRAVPEEESEPKTCRARNEQCERLFACVCR